MEKRKILRSNGASGDPAMAGDLPNAEPAKVVALQERSTGRLYVGERWEQHADLRERCDLGERTDGWLTPGFIDLGTGTTKCPARVGQEPKRDHPRPPDASSPKGATL